MSDTRVVRAVDIKFIDHFITFPIVKPLWQMLKIVVNLFTRTWFRIWEFTLWGALSSGVVLLSMVRSQRQLACEGHHVMEAACTDWAVTSAASLYFPGALRILNLWKMQFCSSYALTKCSMSVRYIYHIPCFPFNVGLLHGSENCLNALDASLYVI